MRTARRLLAALVSALLLAGCGAATGAGAAAVVDGDRIPRSELDGIVRELTAGTSAQTPAERADTVGAIQRQVLTLMIQAEIIDSVVRERGLDIDDSEAEDRLAEEIEAAGGEEQFEQLLVANQLTLPLFRDVLLPAQLRVDALMGSLGADVEVRRVRHILVETEDEAQEVLDELEGGADFAELAQERSVDEGSAVQGGDLGTRPRGEYVPEFDEAAWEAQVGQVVGPVQSQFGFHVLEVTETGTAADLEAGERDQAAGTALNAVLDEAFTAADVRVGAGLGRWDDSQAAVVPPNTVGEPGAEPALPGLELDGSGE